MYFLLLFLGLISCKYIFFIPLSKVLKNVVKYTANKKNVTVIEKTITHNVYLHFLQTSLPENVYYKNLTGYLDILAELPDNVENKKTFEHQIIVQDRSIDALRELYNVLLDIYPVYSVIVLTFFEEKPYLRNWLLEYVPKDDLRHYYQLNVADLLSIKNNENVEYVLPKINNINDIQNIYSTFADLDIFRHPYLELF